MRDIEKLLRKISKKDRQMLLDIIGALTQKNHTGLVIKRLQGNNFYRVRKGTFRIIFHYNKNKETIIDSIRMRNESTYRDF